VTAGAAAWQSRSSAGARRTVAPVSSSAPMQRCERGPELPSSVTAVKEVTPDDVP
jgi:hypothetical protein